MGSDNGAVDPLSEEYVKPIVAGNGEMDLNDVKFIEKAALEFVAFFYEQAEFMCKEIVSAAKGGNPRIVQRLTDGFLSNPGFQFVETFVGWRIRNEMLALDMEEHRDREEAADDWFHRWLDKVMLPFVEGLMEGSKGVQEMQARLLEIMQKEEMRPKLWQPGTN